MIEPSSYDLGRSVIYHPQRGGIEEEGVIISFNEGFVFVRYDVICRACCGPRGSIGQCITCTTSTATRREDLVWSFPGVDAKSNQA